MNSDKVKDLIKEYAQKRKDEYPPEHTELILEQYFKHLKQALNNLYFPKVFFNGIGKFEIKHWKLVSEIERSERFIQAAEFKPYKDKAELQKLRLENLLFLHEKITEMMKRDPDCTVAKRHGTDLMYRQFDCRCGECLMARRRATESRRKVTRIVKNWVSANRNGERITLEHEHVEIPTITGKIPGRPKGSKDKKPKGSKKKKDELDRKDTKSLGE